MSSDLICRNLQNGSADAAYAAYFCSDKRRLSIRSLYNQHDIHASIYHFRCFTKR